MDGLFVTATDTGVGKTVLSAALLAALRARGVPARAYKPAVTGLEDEQEIAARGPWPPDHELLGAAAGMDPELVSPLRFGPAVAPQLAAELAGEEIDPARLPAGAAAAAREGAPLIVEGVGGLLTPLAEGYSICDLARELGLPLAIAARPGLGTINHTLLTLQVARAAGLQVGAVVLTPWPGRPDALERSNRDVLERQGEIRVLTLAAVAGPDPDALAAAGEPLAAELFPSQYAAWAESDLAEPAAHSNISPAASVIVG